MQEPARHLLPLDRTRRHFQPHSLPKQERPYHRAGPEIGRGGVAVDKCPSDRSQIRVFLPPQQARRIDEMRQNPVSGVGGPGPADYFDERAPAKITDQKATNNCQQANERSAKLEPRLVTRERDRRLKRDTERTRRFIPYWIRSSGCRPRMFRQLLVQHERVSCDDQKRKRSEREFADPKGADWRQQYAYAEYNAPKCDRRRFVRAEWQR